MPALVSLVAMIAVLSCWDDPRWFSIHAHAAPPGASGDAVSPHAPSNTEHRALRHHVDRYRDPFAPNTVVRKELDVFESEEPPAPIDRPAPPEPEPEQEPVRQDVLVRGIMASPKGYWAVLEFENGERLIVTAGQIIAASSLIVTRITERGVTLSSLGDKADAPSSSDRTYFLTRKKAEDHAVRE